MELEDVYKHVEHETFSERRRDQDEDMDGQAKRGRRCFVLSTAFFGLTCVLLAAGLIVLYLKFKAEREAQSTVMLQTGSKFQNEKDELRINYNSLSQKKLDLEAKVKDLTTEKGQLQSNLNTMSQKKLDLEAKVKDLTNEKDQLQSNLNSMSQKNLDLEAKVKDLTSEKAQLQSNLNSMSQKKLDLEAKVKDLTNEKGQLQSNLNSMSQKVKDLTAGKGQLQSNLNSMSQKNLELERKVMSLNEDLKKEKSKKGYLWGPDGIFITDEPKSWSESRRFCRDRGGDLIIIDSEEKQRFVMSLVQGRVWIGLSDIQFEGNMRWVDNSALNQGFWYEGEPNDDDGKEDCVEMMPSSTNLNNWNDLPCWETRKGICEK